MSLYDSSFSYLNRGFPESPSYFTESFESQRMARSSTGGSTRPQAPPTYASSPMSPASYSFSSPTERLPFNQLTTFGTSSPGDEPIYDPLLYDTSYMDGASQEIGFSSSAEYPSQVQMSDASGQKAKYGKPAAFICLYPSCSSKGFRRKADLGWHMRNCHLPAEEKESYLCDYRKCPRSDDPFHRRYHFRDHLRDYHKEDIEKRDGSSDMFFEGLNIKDEWWRCPRCLKRNYVSKHGYDCPSCKSQLSGRRQKHRRAIPKASHEDKLPKGPLFSTGKLRAEQDTPQQGKITLKEEEIRTTGSNIERDREGGNKMDAEHGVPNAVYTLPIRHSIILQNRMAPSTYHNTSHNEPSSTITLSNHDTMDYASAQQNTDQSNCIRGPSAGNARNMASGSTEGARNGSGSEDANTYADQIPMTPNGTSGGGLSARLGLEAGSKRSGNDSGDGNGGSDRGDNIPSKNGRIKRVMARILAIPFYKHNYGKYKSR